MPKAIFPLLIQAMGVSGAWGAMASSRPWPAPGVSAMRTMTLHYASFFGPSRIVKYLDHGNGKKFRSFAQATTPGMTSPRGSTG